MEWDLRSELNRCLLFEPGTSRQDSLLETLASGPIYPRVIQKQEFVDWVVKNDNKRMQRYSMKPLVSYDAWIHLLQENELENGDKYELGALRTNLYKHWDQHMKAIQKSNPHETEIRFGIEGMLEMAFDARLAGQHTYRAEIDLFLPHEPYYTTVDSVTWMLLPEEWCMFLSTELRESLHVFSSKATYEGVVVTFICEYKGADATSAARQLTLDLCSAQNQRRALGFDDGLLYGATLVGTVFKIFASEWRGDEVVVKKPSTVFALDNLPEFFRCYIFLCRLADHLAEDVQKMLLKWKTEKGRQEIQQRNRKAARNPWRLNQLPMSSTKRGLTDEDSRSGDMQEEDAGFTDREEQFEGPPPSGGNPLVETNLRVLNKFGTISSTSPANDIATWAQHSAGSCSEVS